MSGLTLDQSWWLCQPLQRVAAASPHMKSYPRVKACQQNEAMLDLAITHTVVLCHTQGTARQLVSNGSTEMLCALSKKLGPQRRKVVSLWGSYFTIVKRRRKEDLLRACYLLRSL